MAYTEEQIETIKTRILTALEEVIDPELGIDIVNLGLIYEIRFDGETGHTEIDMTLTTMGCPLADLLTDQIHDAMTEVPEVTNIEVKLVWYPAWTVEKMSRYARIALGIKSSIGKLRETIGKERGSSIFLWSLLSFTDFLEIKWYNE